MTLVLAVDLDAAVADTGPLWRAWLADAARRYRTDIAADADEGELDERLGNWRPLAERFAEDHAPVYLRPSAPASAELRRLQAGGARIGAFTTSPEPLAGVAASQLGIVRRLELLEGGAGALERLLERLGPNTVVVRSLDELRATQTGRGRGPGQPSSR